MKTPIKQTKASADNSPNSPNSSDKQNIADAAEFHAKRITTKSDTEINREFANQPTGNDELEQSIAEDADLKKIAETAYLLAKKREFAPGNACADWLKAESKVEDVLKSEFIDRRNGAIPDRRTAANPSRRISPGDAHG